MTTEIVQTNYTPVDKAECFRLYTQERTTIAKISELTNVKISTIKFWIKSGQWKAEKKRIQEELIKNSTALFMEHIGKERIKTARDHNEIARLIQDAIKEKFKVRDDGSRPYLNSKEIAVLSKALKDCADVSARASGLSDKTPEVFGQNNGQVGPIVVVGLQPTPVKEISPNKCINISDDISSDVKAKRVDPF